MTEPTTPHSRGAESVRAVVRFTLEGRGCGGCRAPDAPAASCAHIGSQECTRVFTAVAPESPGIPARNGLRLIRALLGDHRLVATVIGGIASAHLAPASERRDHTISPSASASFVRVTVTAHGVLGPALQSHHARRCPRPPHPAPNVRDDREAPLLEEHGTQLININF